MGCARSAPPGRHRGGSDEAGRGCRLLGRLPEQGADQVSRGSLCLEIVLPWPSRDLSQNARVHWGRRAKATAEARELAAEIALSQGWRGMALPTGRLDLWVDFYPPTRALPDDDNMLARFKPYRDGLADALGIDDRRFRSHPDVINSQVKGGEVRVRITCEGGE